MTQYGFYFDSTRCTGCKTCELACKDYKDLGTDILFRRIYDVEGGSWVEGEDGTWTRDSFVYHVSNSCNHCDNPACVAACPVGAYVKDDETGLVLHDEEACIGCGACVEACPYDAPKLDATLEVARKCDGCADRVAQGLDPVCVEACLLRCLYFGPIDELRATYGDLADIQPLPDAALTGPNLVVKACPASESADAVGGHVANELEVV